MVVYLGVVLGLPLVSPAANMTIRTLAAELA